MKNKYVKWLAGGFLGLMTVFGLGSCTDDHFDINSTNASGTLWENVVATGECNDFTNILTKAIVNKKAYGVPASLTYAELLKTDKTLTVWAPKDGTYDAQQWLDMLDEAKRLEESGDIAGAADKYKTVEKQFVQNHLSYFDYNGSYPVSKRIALANGKYADYDVPGNTIKGVDITSGEYKNIPSTNGTVHLLNSYIPYAYDLKEVLAVYPEISDLYQYVISKDTLMFDERASTEGSIVDGEMQFVDSVFIEANKVMPLVATDADSLTAAIYFTNNAWRGALEHTKKFFTYKKAYSYLDEKGTLYTDSIDADSLQEAEAISALFKNMYYSLNEQPTFDVKNASVESVKNFFETADSLVSVDYYYSDSKKHQHAPLCRTLTDGQTPIEASNGYVFIVDNFNFKANKSWQFDLEYETAGGFIVNSQYSKSLSTASPTGVRYTVSDGTRNNKIIGKLSNDAYQEFVPSSSAANPVVTFNLPNILSGTYDIYAVFVPENITDSLNLNPKANKFTATLTYDFDEKGKQITVNSTGGKNGTFTTDVTKIDTIKLFEDYKFDVCYYGISKSNPMLTITSAIKLADRKTCTPNLRIDCILLVAKDE
ncbi:MAG: hypothetical protein SOW56_03795 [Bacteroidaceae bacterium]|nr:hypothetical protein [Bacteroidaceae bacterium]